MVPPTIDFLTVAAGQTYTGSFVISSVGTAPLTVNVVSPCPDYVPATGGGPAVIPPGGSITVNISFNPLAGGSFPCDISVGPGIPGVGVTAFATTVSFATDIQPIFNASCAVAGCHAGGIPGGNLFLGAGSSYANLFNVTSFGYAPAKRVVPFDLTNSVLYGKIIGSGQFGQRMPQARPPLPQTMIDRVKAWILEGARNN